MSDSNTLVECLKISEYSEDIKNLNITGSIGVIFLHIYDVKTMLNFKEIDVFVQIVSNCSYRRVCSSA